MEEGGFQSVFSSKESLQDKSWNELSRQASSENVQNNPKSTHSKGPERHYRTLLFNENLQGRNWLQKIKERNRGKWGALQHQFHSWSQSLLSYFEQVKTEGGLIKTETRLNSGSGVHFYDVSRFRERVYLIQIRRVGKEQVGVTVRSPEGQILAYECGEGWRKFLLVTRFCKRVDRKSWILIRDECREEPDNSSKFLSLMAGHIIMYACSFDTKSTEPIQHTKKFKPKLDDLLELMGLIKELEKKEDEFFHDKKREDPEFDSLFWNFSLNNPEKTKDDFILTIKQALREVAYRGQLQRTNADKHYPRFTSQRKKQRCVECYKAKTEICCEGCFLIWKVDIHLCEGKCYKKYHDRIKETHKRRAAIDTENQEFLTQIAQIDRVMNQFAEGVSTSNQGVFIGMNYLNYLNVKTMEEMNWLAARDP